MTVSPMATTATSFARSISFCKDVNASSRTGVISTMRWTNGALQTAQGHVTHGAPRRLCVHQGDFVRIEETLCASKEDGPAISVGSSRTRSDQQDDASRLVRARTAPLQKHHKSAAELGPPSPEWAGRPIVIIIIARGACVIVAAALVSHAGAVHAQSQ